jgi:hypothetical protein
MPRFFLISVFLCLCASTSITAQDPGMAWEDGPVFKTRVATRLVNTHAPVFLGKGEFDFRILHRFGPLDGGTASFFGLDQARMRISLDYGISDKLSIGIGRSTYLKEIDGFVKYRLADEKENKALGVVYAGGVYLNGLRWADPSRKNFFSSRLAYAHQLLLSRTIANRLQLQLTPGMVHRNLVSGPDENNDVVFVGTGGRYRISQRLTLVADAQWKVAGNIRDDYTNPITAGLDIRTGGHVFQLHVSNAQGMNERAHLMDTRFGQGWRFGFNLSRVF